MTGIDRPWLAVLAMVTAPGVLLACSGNSPSESETETAIEEVVPDWIHPECEMSALGPPGGDASRCNGPWTYTYQEYWINEKSCGAACLAYRSCVSWDVNVPGDGIGYTVASSTESSVFYRWGIDGQGNYGTPPEEACGNAAIAKRNALAATRPGMSPQASAGFRVNWRTVNEVRTDGNPQGQDWYIEYVGQCELDIVAFPTPIDAVRPWCGCAVPNNPECVRTGDATYSNSGAPITIPDSTSSGASMLLNVPPGVDIKKVFVSVNVTHLRPSDLAITLHDPSNRSTAISRPITATNVVIVDRDVSAQFPSGSAAGNWRLQVRDVRAGAVGTLNEFKLQIITTSPVVGAGSTDAGLRIPADPGAPSAGSSRRAFVQAPSCRTCDLLPVATDADVQNKFACFDSELASAGGALRLSLAARMKLLFQMSGERLTSAQRGRARALYEDEPQARAACSTSIEWDDSCLPLPEDTQLETKAQLCQDLVENQATSSGIAGIELEQCLALPPEVAAQGDACRQSMRDTLDDAAQALIHRAQPSFAQDFSVALPIALTRIALWWDAAKALAADDHAWFDGKSSALARWLWSAIEADVMPLPPQGQPANDAAAVQFLADLGNSRMLNDAQLLNAAFTAGQTANSPLLLVLTGDALKAVSDRVSKLFPVHDIGCRFKPCKDGAALVSSATSELVRLLATLPDRPAFTASLAAATHLQTQEPEIYAALAKIRDQHAYLDRAWSHLGQSLPFSSLASVEPPPREAKQLATIVRAASNAWASYQASGRFVPWTRPRLTVAALRQSELVSTINQDVATVNSNRSNYAEQRLNVVRDLLEQARTGGSIASLDAQFAELSDRAVNVANRMDAIEQRDKTERVALTQFQSQFEQLVTSGAVDPQAVFQTTTIPPFLVTAAAANFPNDVPRNVVRDRFRMERLRSGASLRVSVSGNWAPACAVSSGYIQDDIQRRLIKINLGESSTGPEGYYVVLNTEEYYTRGFQFSDIRTTGTSTSSCSAVSSPTGGSVSGCFGSNSSYQMPGTTISNGSSAKTSASFRSGVRLATTPFPEAPAGALVAVITRKGVTGAASDPPILDIRVVERDDVIYAPKPPSIAGWPNEDEVEVHFVVNDRKLTPEGQPCARPDLSQLQISLTRTTPLAGVALPVGLAMGAAIGALESNAARIVAQGELTGAEQSALRAETWQNVQQALIPSGISLAGLPSEVRQFFESYLERQLASIARRAHRDALRRELLQLGFQIDGIVEQRQLADAQNRLLHLIPRWRLRDLTGNRLAGSVAALSETLSAYVAPVFELRDPAAHTNFKNTLGAQIDQLINLEINVPFEDIVDRLTTFAQSASTAVNAAQFELPTTQRRTIVLAIPRPPGAGRPAWDGVWRRVSPTTSTAFWNSVFAPDGTLSPNAANATLTLQPQDIYSGPGGQAHIACPDVAPVVRHIGLYFATEGRPSVLGPANVEIVGSAAVTSPVSFPLLGRSLTFESDDPRGIPIRMRALNGNTANVLSDGIAPANFGIWPAELGVGAGISPFTSFKIDMSVFAPPAPESIRSVLDQSRAIFVAFEIERRATNRSAWVPGVCSIDPDAFIAGELE